MMGPGMRAKVARTAKPVTRRKYFPNLLIFDSPYLFPAQTGVRVSGALDTRAFTGGPRVACPLPRSTSYNENWRQKLQCPQEKNWRWRVNAGELILWKGPSGCATLCDQSGL